MSDQHQPSAQAPCLSDLIKDIPICMMTTVTEDGTLRSRPMATQQDHSDGCLWFFTREHGGLSGEIQNDQHVNLAYSAEGQARYISVTGKAQIVHDQAKIKSLWSPLYRTYFPRGLNDPELALLRIEVQHAELWDSPSGPLVPLLGLAKATLTGLPKPPGHVESLQVDPRLH